MCLERDRETERDRDREREWERKKWMMCKEDTQIAKLAGIVEYADCFSVAG